jgi:hypothetical protein
MDANPLQRKAIIRAVLVCWQLVAVKAKNCELQDEIRRLRARQVELPTVTSTAATEQSIWRMKKAELVEVAVQELLITHQQASNITVAALRHLIKENRDQLQEPTAQQSGLPSGLSRMSHKELAVQADARGINVLDPRRRHGMKVRQQLIMDIQEYEAARIEGRSYQPTNPEDLMADAGFSGVSFMPHVDLSPQPTAPPAESASGSGVGSDPSWPSSQINQLFADLNLPIRH